MNWQEKAEALNELSEIKISFRKQNDWYVSQSTEIGGNGMLLGSYGNGATPEEAVEDHWQQLVVDLPHNKFIVTNAYNKGRKERRWNGYMWREQP